MEGSKGYPMFEPVLVPRQADCIQPHVVAIACPFDAEVMLLRMQEMNHADTFVQRYPLFIAAQ